MPPRRKTPAKEPPAPAKRRSKLAKEHNVTADQEAELTSAFALFSFPPNTRSPSSSSKTTSPGVIKTQDLRKCLTAIDCTPSNAELAEFHDICDPEDTGEIEWEHYFAVAAISLNRHGTREGDDERGVEVQRAYRLFTQGQDREIGIADLRRVARSLREEVPEDVLKDMVREANGGGLGGVGLEEFEGVMKRAGVFG